MNGRGKNKIMDGNEYYEELKKAMDDPNCHGIIQYNGRYKRSKYDDLGFHCAYFANTLESGGSVGIMSMEEDQKYIDNIVWYLSNVYLVETQVTKLYNGGIYDSNPKKFVGYSIKKTKAPR
jgi:hypothetical protein